MAHLLRIWLSARCRVCGRKYSTRSMMMAHIKLCKDCRMPEKQVKP